MGKATFVREARDKNLFDEKSWPGKQIAGEKNGSTMNSAQTNLSCYAWSGTRVHGALHLNCESAVPLLLSVVCVFPLYKLRMRVAVVTEATREASSGQTWIKRMEIRGNSDE